jgi:hypothetical protein
LPSNPNVARHEVKKLIQRGIESKIVGYNERKGTYQFNDFCVSALDVENAHLNTKVDRDIFMSQPEGAVDPEEPEHVCKLEKRLYGLKSFQIPGWSLHKI